MSKSAPLANSFEGFLVVGLVGVVLSVILWPIFVSAKAAGQPSRCIGNLRLLARGAGLYAEDHDHFVDARNWSDRLASEARRKFDMAYEHFTCLDAPGVAYSYAMNQSLSQKRFSTLPDPETHLLFFDSKVLMPNAFGDEGLLPNPPRHGGVNMGIFVDGHVSGLRKEDAK